MNQSLVKILFNGSCLFYSLCFWSFFVSLGKKKENNEQTHNKTGNPYKSTNCNNSCYLGKRRERERKRDDNVEDDHEIQHACKQLQSKYNNKRNNKNKERKKITNNRCCVTVGAFCWATSIPTIYCSWYTKEREET